MNIVVVRTQTFVRNFATEGEARRWIERQESKDDKDKLLEKGIRVEYAVWYSPHPAAE